MLRYLSQAIVVGCLTLCVSSNAMAVLSLALDPDDLGPKSGPGPVTFDVDVFVGWDGNGNNEISSLSFFLAAPAEVALPTSLDNPFNFNLSTINGTLVAFSNFPGIAPKTMAAGNNRLTTLTFTVNADQGNFPIGVTLNQATREVGGSITDIATDFGSVTGGTLAVSAASAIPEPNSMLVCVSAAGFAFLRRRRKS